MRGGSCGRPKRTPRYQLAVAGTCGGEGLESPGEAGIDRGWGLGVS